MIRTNVFCLFLAVICMFIGEVSVYGQELQSLGPAINSQYEDRSPRVSPDGRTLYFARNNHPENPLFKRARKTQAIWYSTKDSLGNWSPAKLMNRVLNRASANFISSVQPSGNLLIMGGAFNRGEPLGYPGFSYTRRTKDGWTVPHRINIRGYAGMSKASRHSARLSGNGQVLLMSFSESPEATANYDLYVSFRLPDNSFGKPIPMDSSINSAANEYSPFLASDGRTLYFSSDRPNGFGDYDLYMSYRLDSTWLHWTTPVNLGAYINSPASDSYFSLDASGEYAYLVSHQNSMGLGDIFQVKLKEEHRPKAVVLVKGQVFNAKTQTPIGANIEYTSLALNGERGTALARPGTGYYQIILPYGEVYGFRATAQRFASVSENLDLTDIGLYREVTQNLYLEPLEVGRTVRINNIFFETASFILQPSSFEELQKVYELLRDNERLKIEVSGHTDNIGDAEANKSLSEKRAEAVWQFLVNKGIDGNRVEVKGYGQEKPIDSNDTKEGRQRNRRVEFTITEI